MQDLRRQTPEFLPKVRTDGEGDCNHHTLITKVDPSDRRYVAWVRPKLFLKLWRPIELRTGFLLLFYLLLALLLEVSGQGGSRLSYVLWSLSVINAIMVTINERRD